jgi:ribosome-associated protein
MRRRQIPGEPEPPSKGELKRHAQSLQALGEALIAAPDSVLDELPLSEKLRDAIELARRITSHGALVRQKQYVGKLMRHVDDAPIRAALEAQEAGRKLEARRFHAIERWRDRIIDEGEPAIAALLAEQPAFDGDKLRQLAAGARVEGDTEGSRRAARALFRALNAVLGAP